jgi:hypothetical protein
MQTSKKNSSSGNMFLSTSSGQQCGDTYVGLVDSCTGQMELPGCQLVTENWCFLQQLRCHFKMLWQLNYDFNNVCSWCVLWRHTQLNNRKFIYETFKYGSKVTEQMEGDDRSSARQFGTCLCVDGQTERWNKEDQKMKSRDLKSVVVLQDTSVGW